MLLTTGVNSGFGRYAYENLGGLTLVRSTSHEQIEKYKKEGVDIIIHCAFNSARNVTGDTLSSYLQDNVFLTKELIAIPHRKFIFFSTVDVYPHNPVSHVEDEKISVDAVSGIYGVTKLMSESLVAYGCGNFLILRATALLGGYSRKNSLIRMIEEDKCSLTVSADSQFNYILYEDVLNFLQFAIKADLKGVYNLASSENVAMSEISEMLRKEVKFGSYRYDVGTINNEKASAIYPVFKKTSRAVALQFLEARK